MAELSEPERRLRAARSVLESTTQSDVQWARWILEGAPTVHIPEIDDVEWGRIVARSKVDAPRGWQ